MFTVKNVMIFTTTGCQRLNNVQHKPIKIIFKHAITRQRNAVNNVSSVDTSDNNNEQSDVSTTHHGLKHAAQEDGHCSHQ